MRLSSSRTTALAHRPQQDFPLWDKAGTRPSLDLQFADRKDLVDATTGSKLVDHTRASSGTYVGSDGLVKTATTNLLLQSESFDQTWIHPNATVSPDTTETVSPIGDNSADKITSNAGTATKNIFQSISAITGDYVLSVYAKKGTNDFIQFYYGGTGVYANFDISTGVSISTSGTASIVEAGGGWYRCVHSFAAVSNTSVLIALVDSISATRGALTSNTNSVYLWGAQLEQSDTVGEYVKTTSTINSAPRFNHDPTTGESLGLLVEEARTNLLLRSEEFDQTWTAQNGYSVTANQAIAPDGTLTADAVSRTDASTQFLYQSVTASGTLTFSCWVRTASGTATFRLSSYNPTDGSRNDGDLTATTTWQRFSLTVTQSGATTSWYPCNGDINTTFYIWGAQLEAGSFPTSYIPTTTAAVTRAADVAGIYDDNFSSWYRQDEGSAFVDAIINGISSQNYLAAFDAGAGFANSHLLYLVNGTPRWQTFVSSAAQCQLIPSPSNPVTVGAPLRIAGGYAADSFAASRNGGAVSTDAAGTLPSVSRLLIGVSGGTLLPTNGHLRRLTYWPTRLPNETLQTITQ